MPELAPLHPISRSHLDVLSTELGIMQHAIGSVPDPKHGYCTDDVARALRVDLLHARTLGWPAVASSAWRNLRFLEAAFDVRTGSFRNFRTMSGHWIYAAASEDSQGRAMLAIGQTIAADPDRPMVVMHRSIGRAALTLWDQALPGARTVTALRARASITLGCVARLEAGDDAATAAVLDELAGELQRVFDDNATSDWPWPEPVLTYENGLLPRALIVAGRHSGNRAMVERGLLALQWLLRVQTASAGYLSPIGNEWWPRGGVRSGFDQQPIEATALLLAAEAAFAATGAPEYSAAMELAYGWFLGANDLGLWVADPIRGSGSDGLTPRGLNTNEGAESTLMWLTAAEHMRAMRHVALLVETAAEALLVAAAPFDGPLPRPLPEDPARQPVAAAIR
ncbi:MAG TPA: hypothetical protein VE011_10915 [Candidatus Dormibacteraeota bacterium]|nr:hypothetical protein [Candidatus Dormibacteraeota bacterium]